MRRPTPPVVTLTLGVDAIVGGTAADFVGSGARGAAGNTANGSAPDTPSGTPPAPEAPAPAPTPSFASEVARFVEPVRVRLLDEAARLELVRRAALDYAERPHGRLTPAQVAVAPPDTPTQEASK